MYQIKIFVFVVIGVCVGAQAADVGVHPVLEDIGLHGDMYHRYVASLWKEEGLLVSKVAKGLEKDLGVVCGSLGMSSACSRWIYCLCMLSVRCNPDKCESPFGTPQPPGPRALSPGLGAFYGYVSVMKEEMAAMRSLDPLIVVWFEEVVLGLAGGLDVSHASVSCWDHSVCLHAMVQGLWYLHGSDIKEVLLWYAELLWKFSSGAFVDTKKDMVMVWLRGLCLLSFECGRVAKGSGLAIERGFQFARFMNLMKTKLRALDGVAGGFDAWFEKVRKIFSQGLDVSLIDGQRFEPCSRGQAEPATAAEIMLSSAGDFDEEGEDDSSSVVSFDSVSVEGEDSFPPLRLGAP